MYHINKNEHGKYNYQADHTVKQYDSNTHVTLVKLFSGDCYVTSSRNEILITILGSCISACVRDSVAGISGMNHFLLPDTLDSNIHIDHDQATRYGAFAMEKLINTIIQKGGSKNRLEIKLFGGANVTSNSALIGLKNVVFVREYMKKEGYTINKEDLGGTGARKIHYFPDSGKVMMKSLQDSEIKSMQKEETEYAKSLILNPMEGDTELF